MGALVFAPHVADPRLAKMRIGWQPQMTSFCGRVGKVIAVDERAVKLYCCGTEIAWDIELFDASLIRYCPHGCQLERRVVTSQAIQFCCYCHVCLARVPAGASTMRCHEHNYDICRYCLGRRAYRLWTTEWFEDPLGHPTLQCQKAKTTTKKVL